MRAILFVFSLWLTATGTFAGVAVGSPAGAEPRLVKVGGYVFPPFVERNMEGEWSGITLELIDLLNASQGDYRFEFHPTSATRRYLGFANGRFDLLFFESPRWGWEDQPVVSLRGPLLGSEVFIAGSRPGRGQEYFASREGKRIALFSGYHYAFAGYNANKVYLRREHDAIITFSEQSNVQMVLRDRVELAVVSQAFLDSYLGEFPHYRSQLLISEEPDQYYRHLLIKRESSEPGLDYFSAILARMWEKGDLQRLFARYSLSISPDE